MQIKKIAVSVLGPPGSGKDTQAALLAEFFGLFHFKTSAVLMEIFKKNENDPKIIIEKERYDKGELCTPDFVFGVVCEKTKEIAKKGKGIIYSGSPRTEKEAENLTPVLEEIYGINNIFPILLDVSDDDVIWRNTHRKMCQKCSAPVIYTEKTKDIKVCPVCGGDLIKRDLDDANMIRQRLKVFRRDTGPVVDYYKNRSMLYDVDGRPAVDEIFENIKNIILNAE